jgi:D-cysteine desulfhydrase family pyridoxal phosphate-dependent enzyme
MEDYLGFPRLPLAQPAPIEEMPRLRAALGPGSPRLFIQRDDYAGPGFGGNKVRKLEFVFGAALRDGVDTVLTIGGIRSNHARITAAVAAKLGLECHLILNGKTHEVPASRYLDELYGARVHAVSASQIRVAAMREIAGELRAQGRKTMEIPLGASDAVGALGYFRAAAEIAAAGVRFDAVVHCSSSGGTQAGLDLGLQRWGAGSARLIGVSPDDSSGEIAAKVAGIRGSLAAALGLDAEPVRRPIEVDDRFTGRGYGIPSAEGDEALRLVARAEGIVLDPVYTAKAMASLVARVRAGEFGAGESVLFVHTGGQMALFNAAREMTGAG